jgi:hypothetical protein
MFSSKTKCWKDWSNISKKIFIAEQHLEANNPTTLRTCLNQRWSLLGQQQPRRFS